MPTLKNLAGAAAALFCILLSAPPAAAVPLYGNIYGSVAAPDGETPVAGAEVFASAEPVKYLDRPAAGALPTESGWVRLPAEETAAASGAADSKGEFLLNGLPLSETPQAYTVVIRAPDLGVLAVDRAPLLPGAVMALQIEAVLPEAGKIRISRELAASENVQAAYRHRIRAAEEDHSVERLPPRHAARAWDPLRRSIFATREGLVGATTANGHVIRENDHFVALPSTTVLCSKGGREFEVRLEHNGYVEIAPVWDVGPWNIHDNYWAHEENRLIYAHLDYGGASGGLGRGLPQAQAAYESGFNAGRDEFGRHVLNPAGIDLADGTFWNGLNLRGNAWISVEYLWLEDDGYAGDADAVITCFIGAAK
jgi:hypothetical protein